MNDLIYSMWLSELTGYTGYGKIKQLIDKFHDPKQIYELKDSEIDKFPYLSDELRAKLKDKNLKGIGQIISECEKYDIKIVPYHSKEYPERLKNIFSPPIVLYIRGTLMDIDNLPVIGIVGTRQASQYGEMITKQLAKDLAKRGFIIASGFAKGIDTQAHLGALAAKSQTIAVVANGVNICFPQSNLNMYSEVLKNGCFISEYPPNTPSLKHHFPIRNRIIAGLSIGVLVTEAPLRSGALITANYAFEENRDLFAVPGNINAYTSKGANYIIRSGKAKFIIDADGIVEEYYERYPEVLTKIDDYIEEPVDDEIELPDDLDEEEIKILHSIGKNTEEFDSILKQTKIPIPSLMSKLTFLEIKGIIKQHIGKRFSIKTDKK